ncbi:MAG: SH3 domain-containing protein [Acidobacteria bacterium]|nr:SH3 domain-containing protein [Acidobacteriota bacterium]
MMKAVAIFWVMVFAVAAAGQERFVRPVDEASQDASFLAFRTKLIAAAERKDLKYVMGVMDPKIQLSFGGHEGLKGFRELYTKEADFWKVFLPVIKNGGKWLRERGSPKIFSAPYSFSAFPDDLDGFEHNVIFGNNVNMRESPAMTGRVIERLSYNIVRITGSEPADTDKMAEWFRVETLGGKKGWVKSDFVRSPLDFRAGFEKKRGVWKMIYFISGD